MKALFAICAIACCLLACNSQQNGTYTASESNSPIQVREFIYDSASFPSCHASTIIETESGTLMASWFGGTEEKAKDVEIWTSYLDGENWTAPRMVADGVMNDTLRHPCWNPVLFQRKDGPLQLFYKVGPSPSEWWGMVIASTDDGKTWSEPERLPGNFLGPIRNKAVQIADGTILSPSSTEYEHEGWRVQVERSTDLGESWELIKVANDEVEYDAIQPAFLTYADGRIQMLCRSKQGIITSSWSEDSGASWSPMAATELPNPNSGIDALTLQDGRHVLVYNPTEPIVGKWGGPRSPLVVAVSTDGKEWEQVAILESEKDAEFSYPAIIQAKDGSLHITYTWKREKIRHVKMDV